MLSGIEVIVEYSRYLKDLNGGPRISSSILIIFMWIKIKDWIKLLGMRILLRKLRNLAQ